MRFGTVPYLNFASVNRMPVIKSVRAIKIDKLLMWGKYLRREVFKSVHATIRHGAVFHIEGPDVKLKKLRASHTLRPSLAIAPVVDKLYSSHRILALAARSFRTGAS